MTSRAIVPLEEFTNYSQIMDSDEGSRGKVFCTLNKKLEAGSIRNWGQRGKRKLGSKRNLPNNQGRRLSD